MFKGKFTLPPLLAGGDATPADVQASLAAELFSQSGSLWASAIAMAATASSVAWSLKLIWPLWWLAAGTPVFLYRFLLSRSFRRHATCDPRAWTIAFAGGAWAVALFWGAAGVFAERSDDSFVRFTVLCVEAIFVASAMARNHASPATAIGTIALTEMPLLLSAAIRPSIVVLIYSGLGAINALAAIATVRHRTEQTLRLLLADRMQTELLQRLEIANQQLAKMISTDSLTQLMNRRGFDQALASGWSRCLDSGSPLSLLMIDVDLFKQFNDHYGHIAGDDCLRRAAAAVEGAVREHIDIPARYGGEEFSVILPATSATEAWIVGERLRKAVETVSIPHHGSPYGCVTVSVGMACVIPSSDSSASDLLVEADKSLYAAKALGRNTLEWTGRNRLPLFATADHDAMPQPSLQA